MNLSIDQAVDFLEDFLSYYDDADDQGFIVDRLLRANDLKRSDWVKEDEQLFEDVEEFFYLSALAGD